ncbi:MAG: hypothetical protein V3S30_10900 [Thermoanaerobaculia bacterium]
MTRTHIAYLILIVLECAILVLGRPAMAAPKREKRPDLASVRGESRSPRIEGELPTRVAFLLRASQSVAERSLKRHASCRGLFIEFGTTAEEILPVIRYARASGDNGRRLCGRGNVSAYVGLGTGKTWICLENFSALNRYEAAMVVLHEALHHAGLSEWPVDPEAPKSSDINNMVRRACHL